MVDKAILTILKPFLEYGALGAALVLAIIFNIVQYRRCNKLVDQNIQLQKEHINDYKDMSNKHEELLDANNSVMNKLYVYIMNGGKKNGNS